VIIELDFLKIAFKVFAMFTKNLTLMFVN